MNSWIIHGLFMDSWIIHGLFMDFGACTKVAISKKNKVPAFFSCRDVSGRGKVLETVFGEHTFSLWIAFFSCRQLQPYIG